MAPENTSNQSPGDRVINYLSRMHETYDRIANRVRSYTPYLVRTVEVVLALVLFAVLAHWLYWVYIVGP